MLQKLCHHMSPSEHSGLSFNCLIWWRGGGAEKSNETEEAGDLGAPLAAASLQLLPPLPGGLGAGQSPR